MPLKKILFRPGVNRENTRYASEALGSVNSGTNVAGGWYESEKKFRENIVKLSNMGSSPAQTLLARIIEESKLNRIDR